MNLNVFPYTKERRRFGRQPLFSDRNEMLFDERSHHSYFPLNYILKNPIDAATQLSDTKGFSEVETDNAVLAHHGMLHVEGGWPKDVNYLDEEASLRHRKKAERDDSYAKQLMSLTKPVMSAVEQNIAVNIYEDYFSEMEPIELRRKFEAVNISIYHDVLLSRIRPIFQLGWSPCEMPRFLSLHSSYSRFVPQKYRSDFYIWDIENPLRPMSIFTSVPHLTTRANICPRDENLIAGGLKNGMAVVWDTRTAGAPVNICPLEVAHRDSVSALCWVHSKSNTEFYTGSTDGSICYWDGRNMKKCLQKLLLDPFRTNEQSMARAHGVSVLEFEYTIPIRYMACSEQGYLFLGNRKGFTPNETLIANYRVMSGPVLSIERNPFFVKNFLVVGEWCVKIWTEECKDYPITRFPNQESQLTCGVWSPTRCSLFFTGNEVGELDFWDLLLDHKKPVYTMRQFKSPITAISAKEDGTLLAVSTASGIVYMIKLEEAFIRSNPKDKALVSAMFERELQRCKLLEGRVREIKLNAFKNNTVLSLDSMLDIRLLPKQFTDEDEPYDDMSQDRDDLGEEEETHDQSREQSGFATPVAGLPINLFSENEDGEPFGNEEFEEGDIETISDMDPELTEIRARFLSIVNDEIQRNREKVYIMEPCAFDEKPIELEGPASTYAPTTFDPFAEEFAEEEDVID